MKSDQDKLIGALPQFTSVRVTMSLENSLQHLYNHKKLKNVKKKNHNKGYEKYCAWFIQDHRNCDQSFTMANDKQEKKKVSLNFNCFD